MILYNGEYEDYLQGEGGFKKPPKVGECFKWTEKMNKENQGYSSNKACLILSQMDKLIVY